MRSDQSMDQEIRMLERRIADRRVALENALAGVRQSAAAAKARVRERATSPIVWGAALLVGFVIARLARRRRPRPRATLRFGRSEPPQRTAMAAVISAMLPFALRMAQHSLAPLVARAMHSYGQRRAYAR